MASINFKRGGTFVLNCSISSAPSFTFDDYSVSGSIRLSDRRTVDLDFSIVDAAAKSFILRKRDTSSWPLGLAFVDFKITSDAGDAYHSETVDVEIKEAITR